METVYTRQWKKWRRVVARRGRGSCLPPEEDNESQHLDLLVMKKILVHQMAVLVPGYAAHG